MKTRKEVCETVRKYAKSISVSDTNFLTLCATDCGGYDSTNEITLEINEDSIYLNFDDNSIALDILNK